jgi:hypothetical protein
MTNVFDNLAEISMPLPEEGDGPPQSRKRAKYSRKGSDFSESYIMYLKDNEGTPRGYLGRSKETFLPGAVHWWAIQEASRAKALPVYLWLWREAVARNRWDLEFTSRWEPTLMGVGKNCLTRSLRRLEAVGLIADVRRKTGSGTALRLVEPGDAP